MDISRDELAMRFRDLSDEELLNRLRAGTLTPLAAEVASTELRSRGIEPPSAEADDNAVMVPAGKLVTVAEFWNPVEANLLRSLLQSEGIFVHLWGEHLGVAHTFLSVASGGMKVQGPASQVAQAQELIAAFKRGDLAMDEEAE